jgi:hypothetical protein
VCGLCVGEGRVEPELAAGYEESERGSQASHAAHIAPVIPIFRGRSTATPVVRRPSWWQRLMTWLLDRVDKLGR